MKQKFITQSFGGRSITVPANGIPVIVTNEPFDEAVAMTINFLRYGCAGVQLILPPGDTVVTQNNNRRVIRSQLFSLATDKEFIELHRDNDTGIIIVKKTTAQ